MTAVLGWARQGTVYLAGDSLASDGSLGTAVADGKVFRHGTLLLGFAGLFRAASLLRYHNPPPGNPKDVLGYLRGPWARSCAQFLSDQDATLEDTTLLVGWQGALYHVEDDWTVHRYRGGIASIGDGGLTAEASLRQQIADGVQRSPEAMMRSAVRMACKLHVTCGGKVSVLFAEKST